jgi:hypothetical protein
MRILTLPVDDSIADTYNSAAPQEKSRINSLINMLLAKFLKEKENSSLFKKLGELMDWDEETMKNLFGEDYNINA